MDIISRILHTHRLHADVFHNAKYCGSFNVNTSQDGKIPFHILTEGECYLTVPGYNEDAQKLVAGDLVLFLRAEEHHLIDKRDTDIEPNSTSSVSFAESEANGTGLVCGFMEFDHLASNPLIDSLPDYLVIKSSEEPWCFHLSAILEIFIKESLNSGPGSQVTLNRLTDVIFVLILREYIFQDVHDKGLAAALSDAKIARSLKAMYNNLTRDWDVDSLAEIATMSRSVFAKRFKELLATSPMNFLTKIRMEDAYRRLKDQHASVIEVAVDYGYATESAFAKAFKRVLGQSPGAVRNLSDNKLREIIDS
ncbi:MAG: AraC family transcriptional regulator [Kangiellaceae bacterium]|nr:AraC family transcriptional regulator [Kangiellaceae bacterium]MCW8998237.1 AraC family transcriptional regulator [Kangiellaceae bacterium]MCW9017156.1 AraC family transcriptional regulator [Kangiellaceae bacterium]